MGGVSDDLCQGRLAHARHILHQDVPLGGHTAQRQADGRLFAFDHFGHVGHYGFEHLGEVCDLVAACRLRRQTDLRHHDV